MQSQLTINQRVIQTPLVQVCHDSINSIPRVYSRKKVILWKFNRRRDGPRALRYQSGIENAPVIGIATEFISKDAEAIDDTVHVRNTPHSDVAVIPSFSLDSVFNRPYLYPETYVWSTSNQRFSLIAQFTLPQAITSLATIAPFGALQYHALMKSDFKMTMRADATNFNQGAVVAFAVPGNVTNYDSFVNMNFATLFNYPHTILSIGTGNSASLEIPYASLYEMISVNFRDYVFSSVVYVVVLSPLVASTAAPTTINLAFYFEFLNSYVGVKTTYLTAQSGKKKNVVHDTPAGSIIKPISHAILDNFNVPFGGAIKSVGRFFGLYDRVLENDDHPESHRCGDEPIVAVNTKFNSMEMIPNESYRFKQDSVVDLLYFARKWSLIKTVTWSNNIPAGQMLSTFVLSPSGPMILEGSQSSYNTYFAPNHAAVASMFSLFRGSMEVMIMIMASSMAKGNLTIAQDPYGGSDVRNAAIVGLPTMSLAVGSNDNKCAFVVPYSKHKDYVQIQFPEADILNQLARIYMLVQTAYAAPVNTPTACDVLIFARVGEDAEFKYPMPYTQRQVLMSFSQSDSLVYQSSVDDVVLESFYNKQNVKSGFIIGRHTNIYDLMRRPEYLTSDIYVVQNVAPYSDSIINKQYLGGRIPYFGFHKFISQFFKYNSGAITVHMVSNTNMAENAIANFYYYQSSNQIGYAIAGTPKALNPLDTWRGAMHIMNKDPAVNLIMPGYGQVPFFYNNQEQDATTNYCQQWCVDVSITTIGATTATWYFGHSVADDFHLYWPVHCPKLGIILTQEEQDGVFPPMTASSVGGFSLTATNVTNYLNSMDQNLSTYATLNSITATLKLTMPVNNTYIITKFFLAGIGAAVGQTITMEATLGSSTTTLFGPSSLAGAGGYTDVAVTTWFDYVTFTFTTPSNVAWNYQIFELQIYSQDPSPVIPRMITASQPSGNRMLTVAGTEATDINNGPAFYAGDQNPNTTWCIIGTTGTLLYRRVNAAFVASSIRVVGRPVANSNNFTSWKLQGSDDSVNFVDLCTGGSLVSTTTTPTELYIQFRNTDSYAYYQFVGLAGSANVGLTSIQLYTLTAQSWKDSSQLVPQSFIGDMCSQVFSAFKDFKQRAKALVTLFKGLDECERMWKNTIKTVKIALKFADALSRIVLALYNLATNDNSMLISLALANLASGVYSIACSAEQKDELQPQSDLFAEFSSKIPTDLLNSLKKFVNPSFLFGAVKRILSTLGFDLGDINSMWKRELASRPNSHFIAICIHVIVEYLVHGRNYHREKDIEFKEELADEYFQVEEYIRNFKPLISCKYRDRERPHAENIKLMRENFYRLRAISPFVERSILLSLHNLGTLHKELEHKFRDANLMKPHMEPVSAYFHGGSGVGKTILTTKLIPLLMNIRLQNDKFYKSRHVDFARGLTYEDGENLLTHVFITNSNKKYDSLYRHQPFIVVDDCFTSRTDQDAQLITQLINSAPMEVTKAQIDDKGDIYDSPFVLLSSNESHPVAKASETINSGEKVLRRIGKMFQVGLRNKDVYFQPAKINDQFSDIALYNEAVRYADEVWTFTEYTYLPNDSSPIKGRQWTLSEMLTYFTNEFVRKSNFITCAFDKLAACKYQSENDMDEITNSFAHFPQEEDRVNKQKIRSLIIDSERDFTVEEVTVSYGMCMMAFEDEVYDNDFEVRMAPYIASLRLHFLEDPNRVEEFNNNAFIDVSIKKYFGVRDNKPKRIWIGLKKFVQRMVNKVKEFATENPMLCLAVTGITIATSILIPAIIFFTKSLSDSATTCFQNLVYAGKNVKDTVKHLPKSKGLVPQVATALNQQQRQDIVAIRKNIVDVFWKMGEQVVERNHAFFLNDNTVIINRHFFENEKIYIGEGYNIYLSQPTQGIGEMKCEVVHIPFDQRQYVDDRDYVICTLSVHWPNIRNVSQLICKKGVSNKRAILIGKDAADDILVNWTGRDSMELINKDLCKCWWLEYSEEPTVAGDCGRPYYVPGAGIMGIHSAICNKQSGVATVIAPISVEITPERRVEIVAKQVENKYWSAQAPLAEIVSIDGVNLARNIVRTDGYAEIIPKFVTQTQCDYVPSRKMPFVFDGVPIDPMITNSQKWETPKLANVPLRYIILLSQHMSVKFDHKVDRVLSMHEVINGYGSMNGLELKTSSGLYAKYFSAGKKEIFSALPIKVVGGVTLKTEYEFSDLAKNKILSDYGKTFVELLVEKDNSIRGGLIPSFPFICTIKDELRSIEKYEVGKTRIFEQSSLDFVMLCRKYFGVFVEYYRSNFGFKFHHGIGGDPDQVWGLYASGLLKNSPYGQAFDYKNFDGSVPKECYSFFKIVTDRFYVHSTHEERLARHCLIDNMQNGVHIMGKFVFESSQGNKSGNAFTDVFNSVSNTFLIWMSYVSWQIVVLKQQPNLNDFDRNVKMLTYGDDIVMTIKKPVLEGGYNGKYIQDFMYELGITITSADKRAEIAEFVEFSELTFLKRPFIYDEYYQIWKSPLPVKDILKELKYRPRAMENDCRDIEERIRNVQRFLAQHDNKTYDEVVSSLKTSEGGKLVPHCFNMSYESLNLEIKLKQHGAVIG